MLIPKPDINNEDKGNGGGHLFNRTLPSEKDLLIIMVLTVALMYFVSEPLFNILGNSSYFIVEMMLLFPAMVFLIDKKYKWKTVLRLNAVPLDLIKITVLIGFSLAVVLDELDRIITMFLRMPDELNIAIAEGMVIENAIDLILIGFGVVIVAGFAEEALFRGFLQRSLEKHRGVTKAVTTASLVFAFIHINPWWLIQIVLLAMVLGVLAWRADSIAPGFIIHAINNSLGLWSVNIDFGSLPVYTFKGHVSPLFLIPAILALVWSMKRFFSLTEYLHPEDEVESEFEVPV